MNFYPLIQENLQVKTLLQSLKYSAPPNNNHAGVGSTRLPKCRAIPLSSRKTSHDFSVTTTSAISISSKTMHAVESASDSAAVSAKAHARFSRHAGLPVRGSKMCFPFTARPDPLNEQFFSR